MSCGRRADGCGGEVEATAAARPGRRHSRSEWAVATAAARPAAGYSRSEARQAGLLTSRSEARQAGYVQGLRWPGSEARQAGQLQEAGKGYSCSEARQAGDSCGEARQAGLDKLPQARQAGYVEGLKDAGCSCHEAQQAGIYHTRGEASGLPMLACAPACPTTAPPTANNTPAFPHRRPSPRLAARARARLRRPPPFRSLCPLRPSPCGAPPTPCAERRCVSLCVCS